MEIITNPGAGSAAAHCGCAAEEMWPKAGVYL
jgi:hypothetical protein